MPFGRLWTLRIGLESGFAGRVFAYAEKTVFPTRKYLQRSDHPRSIRRLPSLPGGARLLAPKFPGYSSDRVPFRSYPDGGEMGAADGPHVYLRNGIGFNGVRQSRGCLGVSRWAWAVAVVLASWCARDA